MQFSSKDDGETFLSLKRGWQGSMLRLRIQPRWCFPRRCSRALLIFLPRGNRERGGPFAFQPDAAFSSSPLRPENSQSSRFEIGTVPRFQQPIDHETAASLNFISHRYSLETRCGTGCTTDSSLGGNVRQCLEHADRDD